eukprot:COSAG01_NODE_144_length_24108_cov_11.490441_20_plen_48_part_00
MPGRVPPVTLAEQDMGSLEFGLPLSRSVSVDSGARCLDGRGHAVRFD